MAGPRVTLEFEGDTSDLRDDFDRVGGSARKMQGDVGRATRDISGGVDTTGQKAGDLESGFRGVTDSMSGFSQIAQGDVLGGLTDLAGGAEAFATGLSGVVIPAIKRFIGRIVASTAVTKIATVATGAFNAVMALNPVTLVVIAIAALAAGLVVLFKNSDTARRIMVGTFRAIRRIIGNVVGFAIDRFRSFFDFMNAIRDRVFNTFRGVGTTVANAIRGIINTVRNVWNSTVGGFGFTLPGFLGGGSIRIPRLQTGGIVPGVPGQPTLVLAHGGERISRASDSGGSGGLLVVNLMLDSRTAASVLVDPIRRRLLDDGRRNVTVGLA